MPIIKSAIKKLRQDKKRTKLNILNERKYKEAIKKLKKSKENRASLLKKAYSAIDQALKKGIIHKNKAARLKSRLASVSILENK